MKPHGAAEMEGIHKSNFHCIWEVSPSATASITHLLYQAENDVCRQTGVQNNSPLCLRDCANIQQRDMVDSKSCRNFDQRRFSMFVQWDERGRI